MRRLATASLTLATAGCVAATLGRTTVVHVATPGPAIERQTALDQAAARRQLTLTIDGLQVLARAVDDKLCVVQRGTTTLHEQQAELHYPALAWMAVAAEFALGGALVAGGLAQASPRSAALPTIAGGGLGLGAVVDAVFMATRWRQPPAIALAPTEQLQTPALTTCGVPLPVQTTVTAHSDKGELQVTTDESGTAVFDIARWPRLAFPYAAPIAKIGCAQVEPQLVVLPPSAAAQLVLARDDLDDLETWLYLHGGQPGHNEVLSARDRQIRRQRAAQDQALAAARNALAHDDLALAAAAARQCQQASKLAAPACDALLRVIDDRFIERQVALAQAALKAGQWQAARDAWYRCRLVDQQRPACLRMGQQVVAGELGALRQQCTQALLAADLPRARQLRDKIGALLTDEAQQQAWRHQFDVQALQLSEAAAEELAAKGLRYMAKRKWAWALVVLQRCTELELADHSKCQQLLTVAQKKSGPRRR